MQPFLFPAEIQNLALIACGILALLALLEYFQKKFGFADEISRKGVHIGTGVLIAFGPGLFPRSVPVVVLALFFVVLNILAYRLGWLKSVHQSTRRSFGTVYYPASFLVLTALLWEPRPDIVVAAMLVLAIGDGAAAVVGESVRQPRLFSLSGDQKSYQGSVAMFLGSCIALFGASRLAAHGLFPALPVIHFSSLIFVLFVVSTALFITAWEAISSRGLDNITVPFATAIILWIFGETASTEHIMRFIEGTGLGMLIAFLSYRYHLLTASGAVATYLLASVVYGIGGIQWTLPILAFFILSSGLSLAGKRHKRILDSVYEKSGARDMWQVFANGGVAGIIVLTYALFPDPVLFYCFVGSVAAVTADTWGTEIGAFSRKLPRHILTFARVERGTSGGISLLGTLGGAAGAFIVTAIAFIIFVEDFPGYGTFIALCATGVLGSAFDSILGATMQARYRCTRCASITEKRSHCSEPALRVSGFAWMGNDAVNVACALAGALAGYFCIV